MTVQLRTKSAQNDQYICNVKECMETMCLVLTIKSRKEGISLFEAFRYCRYLIGTTSLMYPVKEQLKCRLQWKVSAGPFFQKKEGVRQSGSGDGMLYIRYCTSSEAFSFFSISIVAYCGWIFLRRGF